MTLAGLLALLEPVGVPVLPPGTPTGSLPALAVVPGDNELVHGNRGLLRRYDVNVVVPRDNQTDQLLELDRLETATLTALVPSSVTIETPLRFTTNPPDEPGYLARVIPVAFIDSEVSLCP